MGIADYKGFEKPDEIISFPKGRIELLHFQGGAVGKVILEPGWRWSEHVKPIAGTEWCEAPHFQYIVSGTMHVVMANGEEFEVTAGSVIRIPPKHDAWVVGDQELVAIDWAAAEGYPDGGFRFRVGGRTACGLHFFGSIISPQRAGTPGGICASLRLGWTVARDVSVQGGYHV